MAIENALKNPVVTSVLAVKSGDDFVAVGETNNPLPVSTPDGLTVSGTATSAAVLFTMSMLNYESITVQVTSAGTGCTITYETSDDSVVWLACSGLNASNTGYRGCCCCFRRCYGFRCCWSSIS